MAGRKEHEMLFQLNAQLSGSFNGTFSKAQQQVSHLQDRIRSLSKTQSDIASYQRQQSAVEATRSKLAVLQQQYDNIQKEMKETEGYSSSLQNKLLAKQQQIDKTSTSLQQQSDKLNQMDTALRSSGVDMGNLSKSSQNLSSQIENLKKQQEEAAESADDYGESAANAFALAQQALTSARIATALKEIVDMYAECINASMQFESAMTGVAKTTDMSDGELAAMSEQIKDLSTEIPIATTDLAGVAEVAGQLGIVKEDLLDFSTIMSMLATATTMSADEAATLLAQFANITRMDPAYYSNLASTIVDLGNNYATTEQKITEMAQGIAASASLAGMSEADMVALSAAVTSLGIETQAGSTSMSKLITDIMTAVETGDNLGMFASIAGMASAEFQEAWGVNAVDALRAFVVGLSDTERNGMSATAALAELGITEARMQKMILSLSNSGDLLNRTLDTANNAWKQNTALTAEAEKRYATSESKLTMMKNSYDNLKVSIGDGLMPTMTGLFDVGTDLMNGASDFISTNPALVSSVTAFVGVLGTATAGMTAYATISKVVKALNLSSVFTNPLMWGVAGAAALVGGIVGVVDAYEDAQIAARRYGDEVTAAADEYKQAMSDADELEAHIGSWKSLNGTIASGTAPIEEVNAAKEQLKETEQWLIDNYGIYMGNDGTISEEEIASLEARNEELRETARLKAEIALYDAKEKYEDAKEEIGDTRSKRDALSTETTSLAKEQSILAKHEARWAATEESDKFNNASAGDQSVMVQEALDALNADLQNNGITDSYYMHFASVQTSLMDLDKQIEKNQKKINEYNGELLEYSESAAAYKSAVRDIIGLNISDIPTDNLAQFAEVAKSIGEQAANAELEAHELESYAKQLTEVAHAAGLLPENQSIAFNADGALNVIEEVADGVDEIDGMTAEIIADANTEHAQIKIGDILYKVLEYDATTGIATLSADGKTAMGQLDIVTGELHKFDETEAEAYVNANTDDAEKNIQNAKTELAGIKDKTVTITTIFKSIYQTVKNALGFGEDYAVGTTNATPGWHLVGEKGPEIVYFGGGETVFTADETKRMLDGAQDEMRYISAVSNGTVTKTASAEAQPASSRTHITIAPQFNVEGGNVNDLGNRLQEFSDIIVGNVMDALDEAGVNAKRGAYV